MITRPFESHLVLEEQISEATLRAFNVGFDQNKFRLEPLVELVMKALCEFALGHHVGTHIPITQIRQRLKQAAELVFTTDKYKKRGEFGELVLHLLLRDWCNTIPLISRIYFKDTHNVPVHGFDGVHITIDGAKKRLWLGESKLYSDGVAGVKNLTADLKMHLKNDYLRKEFALISAKLPETTPEIEHWRNLLHEHQRLDTILNSICIPMVCTYTSELYIGHKDNTAEYIEAFEKECRKLHTVFEDKKIKTSVDVLLMLLPVPSKDELAKELHKRLKSTQAI